MVIEVVMPKLGLNMTDGLIVEWLKNEGDPVNRGDSLFIVESEKVTTEFVSQWDGVLGKILVGTGQTAPVRMVVAYIVQEQETVSKPYSNQLTEPSETSALATGSAHTISSSRVNTSKVLASPLAKRIAAENGIDLATLKGTGPGGQITREDVEKKIQANETSPTTFAAIEPVTEVESVPLEGIRAIIAERMLTSLQNTAQFTLTTEIDVTCMAAYRERMKIEAQGADVPGYIAILSAIVAKSLKLHPELNARLVGKNIERLTNIHLGIAVETAAGLVVVVVRNADRKTILELHSEINALTERARNRKSARDELSGSTFTISNLGMYGIDIFTPIINPPEAAILGIGRINEKIVIFDGKVTQRPMMTLSLTIDHRIVDGAPAARFLQTLAQNIFALE
jgi:pyruvate dehydrogenase E2 component (dihydrolipoamide acetyltransferase)